MAYNRRKRKVKKNIPEAQAHIHSTYNNTVVSITDNDGNVISWASAGTIGYKVLKRKLHLLLDKLLKLLLELQLLLVLKKLKYLLKD